MFTFISTLSLSTTLSYSILATCNHKTLGIYYLWYSLIWGISGSIFSVILRAELYNTGNRYISPENQNFYNLSFTVHGVVMIFFLVMPALFGGLGNYFLPLTSGTPEVSYPRLNNISLQLTFIGYLTIILSIISEYGAAGGWTLYPPLSTSNMNLSPTAIDFVACGLLLSGVSSLLSSINFVATITQIHPAGFVVSLTTLFNWSIILTSILLILALPALTAAIIMIISDLHLATLFFDPTYSGDPIFYQHLFWFFGHPEVYILILPAFGTISQIISTYTQKSVFGKQSMVLAMYCIAILGTIVWGHHMYTTGLEADTRSYFTAATVMISLPTGTKIFNWLCTFIGSYSSVSSTQIVYALIFIFTFTLGGVTGVILGNAAVDIALHDSYYVVAHFHFVLSLGAIISLISAVFCYIDNILGPVNLLYGSTSLVAKYNSLVIYIAIMITFGPLHFLGMNQLPRRIPDYPDYIIGWNTISSIGSIISFLALYILIHYEHRVIRHGHYYGLALWNSNWRSKTLGADCTCKGN
jgi:cytochrome c oxidase subunit 1